MSTISPTSSKPTPKAADARVDVLTPAMRQYVEQKKSVGDAVLLFRMGDFYETFYEDAVLCSKELGIALTTREKGSNPVPLAGIPYHALENYLQKLVAKGFRVAISEQVEDPRQAKGVVKREVVRVVTAGTLTDARLLDEREDNTLAALVVQKDNAGIALVELVGGRFEVMTVSPGTVVDELTRIAPAELLISEEADAGMKGLAEAIRQSCSTTVTQRPSYAFSDYHAEKTLHDHFRVATLSGFGFDQFDASLCAAGAVLDYLGETQKTALPHITNLRTRGHGDHVHIDANSWRSLEVTQTLRGRSREGTLLYSVDRTIHAMGARKLRHWLCAPLTDRDAIIARQDAVSFLMDNAEPRRRVREHLREIADVERIVSRVALARANPRDLVGLRNTLRTLPQLHEVLTDNRVAFLEDALHACRGHEELRALLDGALRDDPPMTLREGGMIANGYHEELDRLYAVSRDGQQWLAEYQRREAQRTGIAGLKVSYNRVFGYYIEISKSFSGEVPPDYVRRQTVKNAERYITDELKKFEDEVLTADERAKSLEYELFEQLRQRVADRTRELLALADALARLDVVAGLAELAVSRRFVRPEIVVGEPLLEIRDSRHPVLDQTLFDSFVPNDCDMIGPDARLFVITGPNMAGKSTYIRQVALLALLAQTGSFVPAKAMRFTLVDRIYARVGASDELMRGQSTFMVEMIEAANILRNASKNSLVILDEIGRGTSTFDGMSLAWAITEYLATAVKCRTLVATHYHELTQLAELFTGVRNFNVAVREVMDEHGHEKDIIFLHKIVPGGADKSYGVHVARLAGVPEEVVSRSREILNDLESGFSRESNAPVRRQRRTRDDSQLALFRDPADELISLLRAVDPDHMTPIDALQRIKEWKEQYGK